MKLFISIWLLLFLDFEYAQFPPVRFNHRGPAFGSSRTQSRPTSLFDFFTFSESDLDFGSPERSTASPFATPSTTRPPRTRPPPPTTVIAEIDNNFNNFNPNDVNNFNTDATSHNRAAGFAGRGPFRTGNNFNSFSPVSRFRSFISEQTGRRGGGFIPSTGTHDQSISSVTGQIIRLVNEEKEWRSRFVQISFHDCIGGCDGCLNMEDTHNRGLQRVIDKCRLIQQTFAPTWTLADIIALCGAVASEQASINEKDSSTVRIKFQRGRIDCVGDAPQRKHPEPHDTDGVKFLMDEFGVTTRGAVALLGSHSLGQMHLNHSGHGPHHWDESPEILDRGYYVELVRAKGWHPVRITNEFKDSVQWEAQSPNGKNITIAALNADMALFKKFGLKNDFHEPDCDFEKCEFAKTVGMVNQFNNDNAMFHREYSRAFELMINKRP